MAATYSTLVNTSKSRPPDVIGQDFNRLLFPKASFDDDSDANPSEKNKTKNTTDLLMSFWPFGVKDLRIGNILLQNSQFPYTVSKPVFCV